MLKYIEQRAEGCLDVNLSEVVVFRPPRERVNCNALRRGTAILFYANWLPIDSLTLGADCSRSDRRFLWISWTRSTPSVGVDPSLNSD